MGREDGKVLEGLRIKVRGKGGVVIIVKIESGIIWKVKKCMVRMEEIDN